MASARPRAWLSDSSTQGPAIRNNSSLPMVTLPMLNLAEWLTFPLEHGMLRGILAYSRLPTDRVVTSTVKCSSLMKPFACSTTAAKNCCATSEVSSRSRFFEDTA